MADCPYLPEAPKTLTARNISHLREAGDRTAFDAALRCAQSLWLQGLPAQSLLQLNHAFSHDLGKENELMPYPALEWILKNHDPNTFLGNPVRHFQHLATRMSGKNKELRTLRAWLCFHISENVLPNNEFPRDIRQIEKESLTVPYISETLLIAEKRLQQSEFSIITQLVSH